MSGWDIHQAIAPGRALPQVGRSGVTVSRKLCCGSSLLATIPSLELHAAMPLGNLANLSARPISRPRYCTPASKLS